MSTWQFLWKLFRYQLGLVLMLVGLRMVVHAVIPNAGALLTRAIFNELTGDAQLAMGIYAASALLAGLAFGYVVVQLGDGFLFHLIRFAIEVLLRKNIFSHILDRPGSDAVPGSPGEAISRFWEDVRVAMFYVSSRFPKFIALTAFAGFAGFVMVRTSVLVTLVVFLPLLAIVAIAAVASRRITRYSQASRTAAGEVTGFVGELFATVESVKVANAESRTIDRLQKLNDQRRTANLRDMLLRQTLGSVFRNATNIGMGLVLVVAAQAMQRGSFTVGDLALFAFYIGTIGTLNQEIGGALTDYWRAVVSVRRLRDLMHGSDPADLIAYNPIHIRGDLPHLPYLPKETRHRLGVVEATGLTYLYADTGLGIDKIDLRLERGIIHGDNRKDRIGQDHSPTSPAGAPAW